MYELEIFHGERSGRQMTQVIEIHATKARHRPHARGPGDGIEPFEVRQSAAGAVVVSADHGVEILSRPVDDAIRVRTISGEIPATNDAIVLAARSIKNGFEGFPITVDIADDEVPHRSRSC